MKSRIKALIEKSMFFLTEFVGRTRIGRIFLEQAVNTMMNRVVLVRHDGLCLNFASPNQVNRFRIETFSTKEPETLAWIDGLPERSVLWDVGANVGLYSIYAAKKKCCQVYAFEPSVFNLEMLARNVYLNGLSEEVCIVPLPLNSSLGRNMLNMTTTEWGGAVSTFGQDYGWDGRAMKKKFVFQTIGVSMPDAVGLLKLPQPDYIKMDVDGIEHLILAGGGSVLKQIKGILVEINDEFPEQANGSEKFLREAGLTLIKKLHSEMFNGTLYQNSFNQIWVRA